MNAAALRAFDQRSAATGEALWPVTVVIGGQEYAASGPKPRLAHLAVDGGVELAAQLVLRIRKDVLPVAPAIDQDLTAHEADWWIREVTGNDSDAVWTIRCDPKN